MRVILNKEDYQTMLRAVVLMVIHRKSNEILLTNGERNSDLYIECASDLGFGVNKELPISETGEAIKIDAVLISYNKSQIDKLINLVCKLENKHDINNFSFEELSILRKALHMYQKDLDPVIYYSGIDQLSLKNSRHVVGTLGPTMDRIFDQHSKMNDMFYDKVGLAEEKKRIPFLSKYLNRLLPENYEQICKIGDNYWKYPQELESVKTV